MRVSRDEDSNRLSREEVVVLGKSILIVDPEPLFSNQLESEFQHLGCKTRAVSSICGAVQTIQEEGAEWVIAERRLDDGSWAQLFRALQGASSLRNFVIVTASGSVSEAVTATKLGACAYLAKPIKATTIVEALGETAANCGESQARWWSLERAKWEYINMTVSMSGSIAEAARRLRIERRSLRRMLAKHPPPA